MSLRLAGSRLRTRSASLNSSVRRRRKTARASGCQRQSAAGLTVAVECSRVGADDLCGLHFLCDGAGHVYEAMSEQSRCPEHTGNTENKNIIARAIGHANLIRPSSNMTYMRKLELDRILYPPCRALSSGLSVSSPARPYRRRPRGPSPARTARLPSPSEVSSRSDSADVRLRLRPRPDLVLRLQAAARPEPPRGRHACARAGRRPEGQGPVRAERQRPSDEWRLLQPRRLRVPAA